MSANARVMILERVEPAKPDGTAAAVWLVQIDWDGAGDKFIEVHVTEAGARQALAAALAEPSSAPWRDGWVERIEVQSP